MLHAAFEPTAQLARRLPWLQKLSVSLAAWKPLGRRLAPAVEDSTFASVFLQGPLQPEAVTLNDPGF